MLAFIHRMFPLVPFLLGASVVAALIAVFRPAGKSGAGKKARIASLEASIEALERKP